VDFLKCHYGIRAVGQRGRGDGRGANEQLDQMMSHG